MKTISWRLTSVCFLLAIVTMLTSCTDPKTLLSVELDTFPNPNSIFLYEYSAVSSRATGDCNGTFMDRWYGTSMNNEEITELFSTFLIKNGWIIKPEEVAKIWSKKSEDGLYRAVLITFRDPTAVSQEQGSYRLPDSVLQDFTQHETIYLLGMRYMYPRVAEKCFGN